MQVLKVLATTPLNMVRTFCNGIKRNLNAIAILLELIFPLLLIWANMGIKVDIILCMIFVFLIHYLKEVHRLLNSVSTRGMPVPIKRFTKMEDGSFISEMDIPESEWTLYYISTFGPYCEILEPNELKEKFKDHLEKTLSIYK